MLSITDGGSLARALEQPLSPALKDLLTRRFNQLGGDIAEQAHFLVVQPGDTEASIRRDLGFSPFESLVDRSRYGEPDFTPDWEWIEDHGFCFEAVYIFDDSGFAHVLFVPKEPGADAELIALCEAHAAEHA